MSINKFAQIVVASRNSGIHTYKELIDGRWKPKSPDEIEGNIIAFLDSLDDKQKLQLLYVLRYCIDQSFFKLLSSLELGEAGMEFKLSMKDDELIELINSTDDLGLRSKYFKWIQEWGE